MSKRKRTNENLSTPIKQKASKKQSIKNKDASKSEALLHRQKITLENKINKLEATLQIEKTKVDDIEAAINNTNNEKKLETLEIKLKSTKNKIKNLKFNLNRNKNLFKINQQKTTDQNTSSVFSTEKSINTETDQTEQTHNFKQTKSTPKNHKETANHQRVSIKMDVDHQKPNENAKKTGLQSKNILIINSSEIDSNEIIKKIKNVINSNDFGITLDTNKNKIIHLNDPTLTESLIKDQSFYPSLQKKILAADKRPMVLIKGLTYETANENEKNLLSSGFIEIISLKNKFNNEPKAVKLVCKNYEHKKDILNTKLFLNNQVHKISPTINIVQIWTQQVFMYYKSFMRKMQSK